MSLRRVWRALTDPPHQKKVYAVIYGVTAATGLVSLIIPPTSIRAEMGPTLTVVWACLLLMGGTVGIATVWTRWWWLERLGLACAALGLAMYASIVAYLHLTSEGSRLTQLGLILLAGCAYTLRWLSIRDWDYQPPQER